MSPKRTIPISTPGFEMFLDRMERECIALRADLLGCTSEEINALKVEYGVVIPASYRWYLAMMGHKSGRLLTHDHLAASYQYALKLTGDYNEDWSDSPTITLPDDVLVIAGRLGEQFMMIRCCDPLDSVVWYFNEYDTDISMAFPTVLDWLNGLADEAEAAIKSGYFDKYPDGTRP